jgi:predicted  nucleic acid-binding Zn-ribbon protein
MVSARAKDNDGSLNDALEELEKIFVDGIGRLKAAVSDDQAALASEAQRTEQVIEGLKTNIILLEAKLKETEDAAQRKDLASHKMEESLSAEIRDLQSAVKKKEEALESRDSEVKDLKSKIDVLVGVIGGLKVKIAMLETQFTQAEEIVGGTDCTIKRLDQDRDGQVTALNAELEPQTNGTREISSFSSKAESSADIQAQAIGTIVAAEQLKTGEEKPVTAHVQAAGVTSVVTKAARETVSEHAFDRMIAEFSEHANVIESIASLIVRDHVRALGESMEEFPQTRLAELLKSLSGQIPDDKLKADFRQRFGRV